MAEMFTLLIMALRFSKLSIASLPSEIDSAKGGRCPTMFVAERIMFCLIIVGLLLGSPALCFSGASSCPAPSASCRGSQNVWSFRDLTAFHIAPVNNGATQSPPLFSTNGCGTDSVKLDADPVLLPCCAVHDACYSICGIDRDFCDTEFTSCLIKQCNTYEKHQAKICSSSTGMMTMGVQMFGCQAFLDAQRTACECTTTDTYRSRQSHLLEAGFYKDSGKTADEVRAVISRVLSASPKIGARTIFRILEKRNATLIHSTVGSAPQRSFSQEL